MSSFVATRTEFWWDPKRPDDPSLWDSKIKLGGEFFQEIICRPVPLDMNILKSMRALHARAGPVHVAQLSTFRY